MIQEGLLSYRFFLIVRPNMPEPVSNFFWCVKNNHSSSVPILLLANEKFLSHIVEIIKGILEIAFEQFLMTILSVTLNLVHF